MSVMAYDGRSVGGSRSVATYLAERELEESIRRFTGSVVFQRLFQEGMQLVEETAAYLDGPGRSDSKSLERHAALAYAGESMRLTTRLMQVASWLLVHRSIQDGEISPREAQRDKYRLGAKEVCFAPRGNDMGLLPARLKDLLARSERLYDRVNRLDRDVYTTRPRLDEPHARLTRLKQAFNLTRD
jgi:regulator of CtrA degradation